jgi:hypothetical protein
MGKVPWFQDKAKHREYGCPDWILCVPPNTSTWWESLCLCDTTALILAVCRRLQPQRHLQDSFVTGPHIESVFNFFWICSNLDIPRVRMNETPTTWFCQYIDAVRSQCGYNMYMFNHYWRDDSIPSATIANSLTNKVFSIIILPPETPLSHTWFVDT